MDDPLSEELRLRAEIGRLTSAIMTRARRETELETELDAARARVAELEGVLKNVREIVDRPEAPYAKWPRSESDLIDEIHDALDTPKADR